ncbi:MAG: cupin domain-containing protein, partial [Burkholderiales bacterium]
GATAITRTFTAFIPADQAGQSILNVVLTNTPGRTASGTPEYSLRTSINGGRTWSTARTRTFGTTGSYGQRSVWQGLGEVGSFGMVLEGELEVELQDGRRLTLKAGDGLAEVFERAHNGRNTGTVPMKVLVFYAGVTEKALTQMLPAPLR